MSLDEKKVDEILESLSDIKADLRQLHAENITLREEVDILKRNECRRAVIGDTKYSHVTESKNSNGGGQNDDDSKSVAYQKPSPQGALGAGCADSAFASENVQANYNIIKDSLAQVKLDTSVKLHDTKAGIRRNDQPLVNVISKSARYAETTLKLLSLQRIDTVTEDTLNDLFTISYAQLKYLQEEYASLLVQGQFGANTARVFRSLQRNTSAFPEESLEQLRTAVTLTPPNTQQQSWSSNRGGYNSRFYNNRGGPRGRRGNYFQHFGNQSIPGQKPQYPANQYNEHNDD